MTVGDRDRKEWYKQWWEHKIYLQFLTYNNYTGSNIHRHNNFPFFLNEFARIFFLSFLYFCSSTFCTNFRPNFVRILPAFCPNFPPFCPNFWLPKTGGGGGGHSAPLPPASYAYGLNANAKNFLHWWSYVGSFMHGKPLKFKNLLGFILKIIISWSSWMRTDGQTDEWNMQLVSHNSVPKKVV